MKTSTISRVDAVDHFFEQIEAGLGKAGARGWLKAMIAAKYSVEELHNDLDHIQRIKGAE